MAATRAPASLALPPLDARAFPAFLTACHGYRLCFPWQARLAKLAVHGTWPAVIAIETGLGKTCVLDAAVFALAAQAHLPAAQRTAPRRIWYVIDRRLVVDDVTGHAEELAHALVTSRSPVVKLVARRLRALTADGERPLGVVRLRGGLPGGPDRLDRPDLPTILVATIDQFGSRLLFRGYGLSAGRRPIEAALAGTDTLIVADEAHLAGPLLDTLERLATVPAERPVAPAARVVAMSATLHHSAGTGTPPPRTVGAGGGEILQLNPLTDYAHPDIAKRRRARKRVVLHEAQSKADLPKTLARLAAAAARRPKVRVVAVVANRVSVARATREALARQDRKAERRGDVVLLTSRQRPVDRKRLLDHLLERARPGRTRTATDAVLYVVATQAIEVGADLDFDALVTECCPLDALLQRLGRLDRRGDLGETVADVVFCQELDGTDPSDPRRSDRIYGPVTQATWDWLRQHEPGLELGLAAVAALDPIERVGLSSPRRPAPAITGAHLSAWVHTRPAPALTPPPAPYLHGIGDDQVEVGMVWRADLDGDPAHWPALVADHPPAAHEVLPVPLREARAWLASETPEGGADLDQVAAESAPVQPTAAAATVLVQAGEPALLRSPRDLGPGDVLVVPASRGGADRHGWHPTATSPVEDVADTTTDPAIGLRLRLDRRVLLQASDAHTHAVTELATRAVGLVTGEGVARADVLEGLRDVLATLVAALPPSAPLAATARALGSAALLNWRLEDVDDTARVVVSSPRPGRAWALDDTIDDATSLTHPVPLATHRSGVAARARAYAEAIGLPPDLVWAEELAGHHHDEGKTEPRYQLSLHGANPQAAAAAPEPLAKSGVPRARWKAVAHQSGLPAGFRHEALSAALVQAARWDGVDPKLVAHLVGSHHGHGRPAFPPLDQSSAGVPDGAEGSLTAVVATVAGQPVAIVGNPLQGPLDDAWVEQFEWLNAHYGPWGLALLEAVVRLADIACSQEGR